VKLSDDKTHFPKKDLRSVKLFYMLKINSYENWKGKVGEVISKSKNPIGVYPEEYKDETYLKSLISFGLNKVKDRISNEDFEELKRTYTIERVKDLLVYIWNSFEMPFLETGDLIKETVRTNWRVNPFQLFPKGRKVFVIRKAEAKAITKGSKFMGYTGIFFKEYERKNLLGQDINFLSPVSIQHLGSLIEDKFQVYFLLPPSARINIFQFWEEFRARYSTLDFNLLPTEEVKAVVENNIFVKKLDGPIVDVVTSEEVMLSNLVTKFLDIKEVQMFLDFELGQIILDVIILKNDLVRNAYTLHWIEKFEQQGISFYPIPEALYLR
jgi:hypothetical protein